MMNRIVFAEMKKFINDGSHDKTAGHNETVTFHVHN